MSEEGTVAEAVVAEVVEVAVFEVRLWARSSKSFIIDFKAFSNSDGASD